MPVFPLQLFKGLFYLSVILDPNNNNNNSKKALVRFRFRIHAHTRTHTHTHTHTHTRMLTNILPAHLTLNMHTGNSDDTTVKLTVTHTNVESCLHVREHTHTHARTHTHTHQLATEKSQVEIFAMGYKQ